MLREGETLGPYRLQKKLGGGAYGMVFLAEPVQGMVRVPVALKVPYEQSNPLELAVEARVWLRASGHPNIVPVLGADVHDGLFVIASEYVKGGSLRERIGFRSGQGLPPAEVARLASGILAGLEHLHANGVIHRDLKPDNVLLQSGVPRLTDFGVAKVLTRTRGQGKSSGTVMYMPPEAFAGQVSAAADVWSAGVIFYELLTGRLPFDGENEFAIMDAIRGGTPPPLPPTVPPRLRAVIERALAKEPEARFKSAAEMRQALEEGPDPPAAAAERAPRNAGALTGERLAGESKHSPSPAGGGGWGGGVAAPAPRTEPLAPKREPRRGLLPVAGAVAAVAVGLGVVGASGLLRQAVGGGAPSGTPAAQVTVPTTKPPALALPPALVGQAYQASLPGLLGKPGGKWSAASLPEGLTITAAGELRGTPRRSGRFSPELQADGRTVSPPGMELVVRPAPEAVRLAEQARRGVVEFDRRVKPQMNSAEVGRLRALLDAALRAAERAERLDPGLAEAPLARADALFRYGRNEEARRVNQEGGRRLGSEMFAAQRREWAAGE